MEFFNQILAQIKIVLANQNIPESYHGLISLGFVYLVVIVVVVIILFVLLAIGKSGKKKTPSDEVVNTSEGDSVENDSVADSESVESSIRDNSFSVEIETDLEDGNVSSEAETGKPVTAGEKTIETSAGFFSRLKQGLGKTRSALVGRIEDLFSAHGAIDADLLEELEEVLISADVGIATTRRLVASLEEKLARDELKDFAAIRKGLIDEMKQILSVDVPPFDLAVASPFVIIVVGVNGVGKTTTIGKLAKRYTDEGKKVVLGAGDTFRAAAADQLAVWGDRAGVDVIKHSDGADPGAVAFDAVKAAVARKADILILDTAGRLHNKVNLMDELKKIKRVVARELPGAPNETLLVLDATTGQNALIQAKTFSEVVELTGIVMTKLDGTAKGGIVAAICNELNLPIRFVGVGEAAEDLREFDSEQFISALFDA